MAKKKTKKSDSKGRQGWGVLLLGLSLLLLITIISFNVNDPVQLQNSAGNIKIHNWLGPVGAFVSYYLMQWTLGYPIVVLPLLLLLFSVRIIRGGSGSGQLGRVVWQLLAWSLVFSIIFAMPEALQSNGHLHEYYPSGLIGGWLAGELVLYLGKFGSVALLAVLTLTLFAISSSLEIKQIAEVWHKWLGAFKAWRIKRREKALRRREEKAQKKLLKKKEEKEKPAKPSREEDFPGSDKLPEISIEEQPVPGTAAPAQERPPETPVDETAETSVQTSLQEILDALEEKDKTEKPTLADEQASLDFEVKEETQEDELDYDQLVKESVARYKFPSTNLLHDPPVGRPGVTREELELNAETLELKLSDFGVKAKVVRVTAGPVITLYELQPAPGVKVSSIVSLANDLALAMEARGIRIIAPIPGKAAVGIEIPNRYPQTVYLKTLIRAEKFSQSGFQLPLALGKTINGEAYIADLVKMPHLLIAGATGSGKSVGINTVIMSILYAVDPGKVKFMMVDPKKLELSVYRNLRDHYLLWRPDLDEEVITKSNNAVSMLNSIVLEMERRYNLLAELGGRNIVEYNERVQRAGTNKSKKHQLLPYIVVIIDELADLMMVAAKEVETPIARLAQMARAVGVHLIVATQRPSVDVITGMIKANFPARIAYQVATKVDSRTVLDMNGAEQLLGNGDMLFLPPGHPKPIRLQNPFVSTEEVEQVLVHIHRQPKLPSYKVPQPVSSSGGFGTASGGGEGRDALYKEARAIVVQHQQGSISFLQRRLQIGYSRAARLMDQLEEDGIVGPPDGSKPREVLISLQELQDMS